MSVFDVLDEGKLMEVAINFGHGFIIATKSS